MNVLVFLEQREGDIKKSSFEAVAAARRLADASGAGEVTAVLVGAPRADKGAGEAGAYGADRVWFAADAAFARYQPEGYVAAVVAAQAKLDAGAVLFSAGAMGKDLAPRVAARLGKGLASDCTGLEIEGGRLVATRPVYAGKAIQKVAFRGAPALVSLRPKVFPLTEHRPGAVAKVEPLAVAFDAAQDARTTVSALSAATGGPADLTEADVIVSGGRGLKGPENFVILEELAKVIGAAVGASRAAVDAGWRPHRFQIGQTGRTISPKLYLGFGISGAIQHLAGMRTSKVICAINKDPEAPIFKIADYGIVGDLFEVAPLLTQEFKHLLEK
jgi:electron transfer flavoprotein alpha subunit